MGDKSTAISYYLKSLEICQKSLTIYHQLLAIIHRNIARASDDIHFYKEAVEHATQTVDISCRIFGSHHDEIHIYQEDFHQSYADYDIFKMQINLFVVVT